jgi:nitric oxide reductase subunit B
MRALRPRELWNDRLLSAAFWSLNVGLMAMVVLSVLPIGLIQTWASVEHGYAYARSPELLQQPLLQFFRWLRVPGDVLFAFGIGSSVAFILGMGRRRAENLGSLPSVPPPGADPVAAE